MSDTINRVATEADLLERLRRHGWTLERRDGESGPLYRIIEEACWLPVFWDKFDMTLVDIERWLD